MRPTPLFALAAALVALAGAAQAQHPGAPAPAATAASPPPAGQPVDLQGGTDAFMSNPNIRAFYDLSVATLRPGAPKLDVKDYEAKSFAIFRALGVSLGGSPEAMQDHLKLIPRQVVQIVKDDPHVLDSFEAFKDAMVGPR